MHLGSIINPFDNKEGLHWSLYRSGSFDKIQVFLLLKVKLFLISLTAMKNIDLTHGESLGHWYVPYGKFLF